MVSIKIDKQQIYCLSIFFQFLSHFSPPKCVILDSKILLILLHIFSVINTFPIFPLKFLFFSIKGNTRFSLFTSRDSSVQSATTNLFVVSDSLFIVTIFEGNTSDGKIQLKQKLLKNITKLN